jgi:hypothetical protein
MNRDYSIISASVFALMALTHAWGFVLDRQSQMGAWIIPRPLTGLAAILAASLAVWGWRVAARKNPRVVSGTDSIQ